MPVISNRTRSPLRLPGGPTVPAMGSAVAKNWDKQKDNDVVKAWISAKALVVGGTAPGEEEGGEGGGLTQVEQDAQRAESLRKHSNGKLAAFIEKNGGDVPSGANKEELVKLAMQYEGEPE